LGRVANRRCNRHYRSLDLTIVGSGQAMRPFHDASIRVRLSIRANSKAALDPQVIGHPLGATGARLLTTIVNRIENTDSHLGLVTICCGGAWAPPWCSSACELDRHRTGIHPPDPGAGQGFSSHDWSKTMTRHVIGKLAEFPTTRAVLWISAASRSRSSTPHAPGATSKPTSSTPHACGRGGRPGCRAPMPVPAVALAIPAAQLTDLPDVAWGYVRQL
jgi:hypothetical protein